MKHVAHTVLEALVQHLRAEAGTADGVAAPAAILWTDPDGDWRPLLPALLAQTPELVVHGNHDPARRSGPSIWLRCVVDRTLADPEIPADRVPVLYLPGVSRQKLTAGEGCEPELQPLVELLYRGAVWHQRGGHDWTVTAFMTSPQALGLDLARDTATRLSLLNALREVATVPLEQLRRGRLEAQDFDQMLSSDVTRDLLRWMGDPQGQKERMGTERWQAFCGLCEKRFGFAPETLGVLKAGELLGEADGPWAAAWERFEEAPAAFGGIPELLRRCQPPSLFEKSHWPKNNDKEEHLVVAALSDLEGVPHSESCTHVLELERQHAGRRKWVWARLGQAPLASVLEPLAELAAIVQRPLAGLTPDEIGQVYEAGAWRADAAAWRALQEVPVEHEPLVREVVQQLSEPWLAESAEALQQAHERVPIESGDRQPVEPPAGGCLMFVDGLRYDLGRVLEERLAGRGCVVEMRTRWAALPSVTATGKAAVVPVADQITGRKLGPDFAPAFRSGKAVDANGLRAAVSAKGYQVLGGDAGDWPLAADARGYFEFGDIDTLGHERQADLPRLLEDQLKRLTERVVRLLDAGWHAVRVVTDHGWLFLPEGLPRADLPKYLTESRWARCAVVAGDSRVEVPRVVWHWNPVESVALAPGISCFNQQPSYAHGGLSVQECLTPDLLVTRSGARRPHASIRSITWRGMRCLIEAETGGGDVRADLRFEAPNGPSVVKNVKRIDADGSTSLVIADDRYENALLVLVLLAPDSTLLAQRETRVGASS
ncbi:MAG: BREX-1 system phosphatase PglZ type B [Planctomycetota bacterium]